jgi:hypothetical protein
MGKERNANGKDIRNYGCIIVVSSKYINYMPTWQSRLFCDDGGISGCSVCVDAMCMRVVVSRAMRCACG